MVTAFRTTIAALSCLLSLTCLASESLDVHAFSEVVHRGASLTNGNPALGFTASWDFDSGWFVGGGGYYADGEPSGRELVRNLNAHLGWFRSMGAEQAIEVSLSRVEFIDVSNWSYTELRGDWHLASSFSMMLAWSPDYYGRAAAVNLGLTWQPRLGDKAYLVLAGGPGRVGGEFDETIGWGQVGAGIAVARFDMALTWNVVDDDTARIFLTPEDTVAFRISYRLR